MENLFTMDDLGVPVFLERPICCIEGSAMDHPWDIYVLYLGFPWF